jgi:hypothetical protein
VRKGLPDISVTFGGDMMKAKDIPVTSVANLKGLIE